MEKVPVTVDVLKVPSPWTCKDNIWNPKCADCSVPEESYSQDTQYHVKSRISPVRLANMLTVFAS